MSKPEKRNGRPTGRWVGAHHGVRVVFNTQAEAEAWEGIWEGIDEGYCKGVGASTPQTTKAYIRKEG